MDNSQWHPGFSKFSTVPEPVSSNEDDIVGVIEENLDGAEYVSDGETDEELTEVSVGSEPNGENDGELTDVIVESETSGDIAMADDIAEVIEENDGDMTLDSERSVPIDSSDLRFSCISWQ